MRFVQLNQRSARGISAPVALQHAVQAAMRASNPAGELHITYPLPNGDYWIAFENHGQATAFLDILGQLNVKFRQAQEKPRGTIFGKVINQTRQVVFTPGSSSV